jgi:hypothetical protein
MSIGRIRPVDLRDRQQWKCGAAAEPQAWLGQGQIWSVEALYAGEEAECVWF